MRTATGLIRHAEWVPLKARVALYRLDEADHLGGVEAVRGLQRCRSPNITRTFIYQSACKSDFK